MPTSEVSSRFPVAELSLYFLILERMLFHQLLATDFTGQPDPAHRKNQGGQVYVIHVPNDYCQEGEDCLVAVNRDENVEDVFGDQLHCQFYLPHEETGQDHYHTSPNNRQILEFLDEAVSSVSRRFFVEQVRMTFKEPSELTAAIQPGGEPQIVHESLDGIGEIFLSKYQRLDCLSPSHGGNGANRVPDA